jgi:hypothetical protein
MANSISFTPTQRETTLDKILKGLSIANQGIGSVAGVQNIRTSMTDKDLKEEQLRQLTNKGKGPSQQDLLEKGYLLQPPQEAPAPSISNGPPTYGDLAPKPITQEYVDSQTGEKKTGQFVSSAGQKNLQDSVSAYQKDFRSDIGKSLETIKALNDAESLLNVGGPVKQEIARRLVARVANGAGVLTDRDVNAVGGSAALNAMFERVERRLTDGTMRPEDIQEFRTVVGLIGNTTKNQIHEIGRGYAHQMSRSTGMTPDEAEYRLAADTFGKNPAESPEQEKARLKKQLRIK